MNQHSPAGERRPGAIGQNPDVRYLGKLLGDVIRDQCGPAMFERIEHIRSASVDRHRGVEVKDHGLDDLSLDQTLTFVRSFMLFSMLANLAEDRQGVARETGATFADALEELRVA
ncbi:MAG: phosphoenolpyruvate carboxylase, partial [Sphingomicrobium sp.]